MKNPPKPDPPANPDGRFYLSGDGKRIFIFEYIPVQNYQATIFVISGITGINHQREKDLVKQLADQKNRVVVVHPRGTGYSDGQRGNLRDFSLFVDDYVKIISGDQDYRSQNHPVLLFGHSMSCAILLAIAARAGMIQGAILVNPPYMIKAAKGMSPRFLDYVKYACYYIFARHRPVVNMAGNPEIIEHEEDRKDSQARINDPLLVKYFSMYMMIEARKVMTLMPEYAKKATYPLLLLYGTNDRIVDRQGCDLIMEVWQCENKQFHSIEGGSHGKSTVRLGGAIISEWINTMLRRRSIPSEGT